METLMAISVTVIAAIMVLALIFQIPVLFQVRRTAREAGRTVDVRRRQAIHQQTDLIAETGERSVPSAHDRATMQTATTRRAGREDTR